MVCRHLIFYLIKNLNGNVFEHSTTLHHNQNDVKYNLLALKIRIYAQHINEYIERKFRFKRKDTHTPIKTAKYWNRTLCTIFVSISPNIVTALTLSFQFNWLRFYFVTANLFCLEILYWIHTLKVCFFLKFKT